MRFNEILEKVKQWNYYQVVTTRCIMNTFDCNYYTANKVVKNL